MKKKVFLLLLFALLVVAIYVTVIMRNYMTSKNNRTINPDFIRVEQITLDDVKLSFLGSVIGNSFYGQYNGYKYEIIDKKVLLTFYCSKESADTEEKIKFEIYDYKHRDIEEIYIVGKNNRIIYSKDDDNVQYNMTQFDK